MVLRGVDFLLCASERTCRFHHFSWSVRQIAFVVHSLKGEALLLEPSHGFSCVPLPRRDQRVLLVTRTLTITLRFYWILVFTGRSPDPSGEPLTTFAGDIKLVCTAKLSRLLLAQFCGRCPDELNHCFRLAFQGFP